MSEHDNEQAAVAAEEAEGFYAKGKAKLGLFFQLFDGSICIKSKEFVAEDGWEKEPIETMNPRDKKSVFTYVKRYDKLVCRVVDANKRTAEFGGGGKVTNYNFTLRAGPQKGVLQTVWMDAMLRKFLKVAPNIDFEKPIMFGAFRKVVDGKNKQLISIRQGGTTRDSEDWKPVPFYWQKEQDAAGNVDYSTKAVGADGSICPDVEHDEDDDTYDSKAQNKFLAKHFVQNTLPRIKEIAERLGLNKDMVVDDLPTHTGGPVKEEEEVKIPVVKHKPENGEGESTSLKDAATPSQVMELKKLAKQIKKDPDTLAQKFLDIDFDDLSIKGAAYMKYKIERRIKKAREEDPDAFPEPAEDSKLKEHVQKKKAQSDDDEDDWGAAKPPKKAAKKSSDDDDDDDDDDDGWSDDKLKDKDGNVLF